MARNIKLTPVATLPAMETAKQLVLNSSKEIDLNREFSSGLSGGPKTFISEHQNSISSSFSIDNSTAVDVTIVLGHLNNSQFDDAGQLVAACDGTALADDGIVYSSGGKDVTMTSNDPGRTIGQMLRYASNSPFRFTKLSLHSKLTSGTPDTSNYDASLKTVFVSPWQKPQDNYLNLRQFMTNIANSPQFADIDFLKEGFPMMLSSENFICIKVKAGTILNVTLGVGMQMSLAQKAYRAYKQADELLGAFRG